MQSSITFNSKLTIIIEPFTDVQKARINWGKLEKYRSSIFLSWAWMDAWLTTVQDMAEIYTINFYTPENILVGIAFFAKEKIRRRKLFIVDTLSLNETNNTKTKFIIEYNNILHNPKYSDDVFFSFFELFSNSIIKCDELHLNALDTQNIPDYKKLSNQHRVHYIHKEQSIANYVTLERFNNCADNYIKSLSKNKREQIRRSIKYFSHFGEKKLTIAKSKEQALEFFDELGKLHQKYWLNKTHSGSFSNPYWVSFHNKIIKNNFDNIFLAKISFGGHICGYLYNFIDNNCMYSIQSGFDYGCEKNNRPGLVSHYYALCYAIENNYSKYDFLAGDSQYKRSFSNSKTDLSWIIIQNPSVSSGVENLLIKGFRLLKKII